MYLIQCYTSDDFDRGQKTSLCVASAEAAKKRHCWLSIGFINLRVIVVIATCAAGNQRASAERSLTRRDAGRPRGGWLVDVLNILFLQRAYV